MWILRQSSGNSFFFTGSEVVLYWGMMKISKELVMSKKKRGKGRVKYQRGIFFFINQNSQFVPVIPAPPDTTLKERCIG